MERAIKVAYPNMSKKDIKSKVKQSESSPSTTALIRSSLSSHINELRKPAKWKKIKDVHDSLVKKRLEREQRRERRRLELIREGN